MNEPPKEEIKEVSMDVSGHVGGATTRRRRGRRGTKRAPQHGGAEEEEVATVIKETPIAPTPSVASLVPASAPAPAPAPTSESMQSGGAKKVPAPVVVLAPAKKKQAKVLLVPKGKTGVVRPAAKTFKAKRVRVTIDNTAKTQKQRRQVMQRVEAMTDDQIRAAAVGARLSRRESVAKAPVTLLRQMVKDYQTMRGMFL